jgi:hypothetical protein
MDAPATDLARFQDAFAQALLATGTSPGAAVAALADQSAFAVYRNTVMKGCIDALEANYPAVARLVGGEWFRAAAACYARQAPPSDPTLLRFGASFPEFLARFEPAADLPYLPGVARLDRLWTEAHEAPDAEALDPAALAHLAAEALAGAVLRPHPAARWAWFPEGPVHTIWSRNRADRDHDAALDWRSEGSLIVRPGDAVEWLALDAAGCAFLDACAGGETLGVAAAAAIAAQPGADLAGLTSTLLTAGALADIRFASRNGE